jgi:hypothetical protein
MSNAEQPWFSNRLEEADVPDWGVGRFVRSLARRASGAWNALSGIAELRPSAVIHQECLYYVEPNTAQQLRVLVQVRGADENDAQSEAPSRRSVYERFVVVSFHLTFSSNAEPVSVISLDHPQMSPRALEKPPAAAKTIELEELSSAGILNGLEDPVLTHEKRRLLIIEAEAASFDPQQVSKLNPLLREFVTNYRESNDPADLVAVGAAIRKCVATLSLNDALIFAESLLKESSRTTIPPEVELELVKMVVRKLIANTAMQAELLPDLADRLFEIASTYLKPRLLGREKHGAIALNAVLGLVLLRSRHVAEVVQLVSALKVPWFRQLLARRSVRLEDELRSRFPREPLEEVIGSLRELASQVYDDVPGSVEG